MIKSYTDADIAWMHQDSADRGGVALTIMVEEQDDGSVLPGSPVEVILGGTGLRLAPEEAVDTAMGLLEAAKLARDGRPGR
jgi:hypothetical protein